MSIEELQRKLELDRQNRDHYRALAAHPKLSRPAALAAHNLARSHQAATDLSQKALAYERAKARPA